jgi:hypothetical protein
MVTWVSCRLRDRYLVLCPLLPSSGLHVQDCAATCRYRLLLVVMHKCLPSDWVVLRTGPPRYAATGSPVGSNTGSFRVSRENLRAWAQQHGTIYTKVGRLLLVVMHKCLPSDWVVLRTGPPRYAATGSLVGSNTGSFRVSRENLRAWAQQHGTKYRHIATGSPCAQQHGGKCRLFFQNFPTFPPSLVPSGNAKNVARA